MANDKVKFVDDKRVYDEETSHLAIVEGKLDVMCNDTWKRYLSLKEEVDTFVIYDWDDRDRLIGLKPVVEATKRRAETYYELKPNPYFMRIDIEIDNQGIKKYYVGEKSLIENNSYYIIYDWRDPVLYEARFTRNKSFKVEKKFCELYLRRAIDIRNQQIERINTEFDSDALILGDNVIDPFLLSVLRDKRRNNKLTNIIKTIQQNQSEIISKPIEENFVVQGCAGSGKTMILLHRLSYLLHNHKNYTVDQYCILTPNEFFNLHINDLSRDLEIDRIKRYTVEQFYEELMERMSFDDSKISSASNKTGIATNIKLLGEQLISEKLLDEQLLSEIYSDGYIEALNDIYFDIWNRFNTAFSKQEYHALERVSAKAIPIVTECNCETYRNLNTYYSKLISIINQNERDLATARDKIEICLQTIEDCKRNIADSAAVVPDLKNKIESKLSDALNLCGEEEEQLYSNEDVILNELKKLAERKEKISSEIGNAFTDDERNMTDEELISFEYITKAETAYAMHIKSNSEQFISKIAELQITAKKVPFYNFGKKSAINKQIESQIQEYQKNALVLLNEYQASINSDLITLQTELQAVDAKLDEEQRTLKDIQVQIRINASKLLKFKKAKDILGSDDIRILNSLMEEAELSFLKRDIKNLVAMLSLMETSKKNIVDQEKRINKHQKTIDLCNERNIDETVQIELAELKAKIDIIDVKNIWDTLEETLKETYSRYNQCYNENEKYRHKLYVMLYMCFLYYGKSNNVEKFINIDEAQDIAISEYRLLREVLGDEVVFNMYGDVNQLVYTYKGITDWDELNDIVNLNLYFLNENYRNTIQITNYCNKVFDAEIVAIGISGEDVRMLLPKNAIADIQKFHRLNPEFRTAIIYKKGHEDLAKKATNWLLTNEYDFNSVDNSKISVITVEMAKGLEFEKVVVLTEDMSINEKYISYTRALESLTVT